jgi:hypothetical protein
MHDVDERLIERKSRDEWKVLLRTEGPVFFYKDVMLKFLEHAEAMDEKLNALEKIAGEKKPKP